MKFSLNSAGLGSNGLFDNKKKKYILIGIAAVVVLLLLILLLSGGSEEQTQPAPDAMLDDSTAHLNTQDSNQSAGNSGAFVPPPLDNLATPENLAIPENLINSPQAEANSNLFDVPPTPDANTMLPPPMPQNLPQNVPNLPNQQGANALSQASQNVPLKDIPPLIENNLSMSQRGISPERIVAAIDRVNSCDCDALNARIKDLEARLAEANNKLAKAGSTPITQENKPSTPVQRAEIRPDDMIVYLKAKQPLMTFDGQNLVFDGKTYAVGGVFKGWWKIEFVNNVYVRFLDDLSGYAYNLRFLNNQGGM